MKTLIESIKIKQDYHKDEVQIENVHLMNVLTPKVDIHEIILSPKLFKRIWNSKFNPIHFKISKNDNNEYKKNDRVEFREYDSSRRLSNQYTGRKVRGIILNVYFGALTVHISGLEDIKVIQYVDSETYKKLKEEK